MAAAVPKLLQLNSTFSFSMGVGLFEWLNGKSSSVQGSEKKNSLVR